MCGESWHAMKDSLTHHPSSQGWAPGVLPFCTSVLFVSCMYLDGGMGGGGWLLTSFFSIIYILGLVCYKHTIHVYAPAMQLYITHALYFEIYTSPLEGIWLMSIAAARYEAFVCVCFLVYKTLRASLHTAYVGRQ